MEDFYRQIHSLEGAVPDFPQHYLKGVLLGCVYVVGCLTVGPSLSSCLTRIHNMERSTIEPGHDSCRSPAPRTTQHCPEVSCWAGAHARLR